MLGRPDSLGSDQFHTQKLPTEFAGNGADPDPSQIVSPTVELSRITRKTALDLYTRPQTPGRMLLREKALHDQLEGWHSSLPLYLRWKQSDTSLTSLRARRDPDWQHKQAVIVELCRSCKPGIPFSQLNNPPAYHYLGMLIHAPTLNEHREMPPDEGILLSGGQGHCIKHACNIIQIVYTTFSSSDWLQSWYVASHEAFMPKAQIVTCAESHIQQAPPSPPPRPRGM